MSDRQDIRARKKELRRHFKQLRGEISPRQKARWDSAILRHILALPAYRESETVLLYLSTPEEIDTLALMEQALADGKQVAVPYCVPGTRLMEFYPIQSLGNLVPGAYGILEPDPAAAPKLTAFTGSICLVPGLAYDSRGYRLGYGGGYYDRFLSGPFGGQPTVGVCYGVCTVGRLDIGSFDVPCRYLVTETGAKVIR